MMITSRSTMKYTVDVKDTSYATIVVDAPSKEAAEEIAMDRYYETNGVS